MKIKRNFWVFSFILLCAGFVYFSCSNISSPSQDDVPEGKARLLGKLALPETEGAVPGEIAALINSTCDDIDSGEDGLSNGRAATYTIPNVNDTSKYEYYVRAVCGNTVVEDAEWTGNGSDKSFSMQLDYGSWDVEAGVRDKATNKSIYSSTEQVDLPDGGPKTYSKSFVARPNQSDIGYINLEMNRQADYGIKFVKLTLLNGNATNWSNSFSDEDEILFPAQGSGGEFKIGGQTYSINSGTYTIRIDFFNDSNLSVGSTKSDALADITNGNAVLVYSTVQTINIYDYLVTSRWITSSELNLQDNPIQSTGTFVLSNDLIENFTLTNICVSSNGKDSNMGTVYNPYKTLNKAMSYINERGAITKDFTVLISGDVECNTEISLDSGKAKSLTIKGKSGNNENDKLNGATKGRVLTINTTIPITIENLTITGGDAGSTPGGGILIDKSGATVILGDGAKISGNKAQNGGGICVQVGASLFMHGTALVGDSTNSKATGDTLGTGCSNYAGYTGGGIYNNGNVYLGYSGMNNGTPVADSLSGGVRRNFSGLGAAGIENMTASTLKINSGYVSYNVTKQSTNVGNPGGGIRVYQSKLELSGGEISYNEADAGGGIEAASKADITISGGKIAENTSRTGFGGAIDVSVSNSEADTAKVYLNSTFSIPYGVNGSKSAGKNDIYLNKLSSTRYATLYVTGDLNPPNGVTTVATITMSGWKRNKKFLEKSGNLSALTETIISKFSFTDSDWGKQLADSNAAAVITSPVYVAGTEVTDNTRPSGFGKGITKENGALGTKSKPFSTIKEALEVFEDSSKPAEITIAGTVTGAQTIGGSGVTIKANAVTIKGYKASGATSSSAALNGGGSTSSYKVVLTVNTSSASFPVTIQDLTIKGGYSIDSGAGLVITKGTVTLTNGSIITGNTCTNSGGGVYVGSNGTLFMNGTSLIGDSASSTSVAGSSSYANKAGEGAGIYNAGGRVYIGCDANGSTENGYAITAGYGIRRNYATSKGGGYYTTGSGILKIAGGAISYNQAASSGGGLYIYSNTSAIVDISGGTFEGNKAVTGGYIYNGGTLTMTGGTVGGSSSTYQNTATSYGGAVYQNGTFNLSGSANLYFSGNTAGTNDVYQAASTKYITVNDTLNGSSKIATITPYTKERGKQVLVADGTKVEKITSGIAGCFAVSDAEWSVTDHSNVGKIDAELWVSGTGYASTSGVGSGSDSNIGTKSKPFSSIKTAAEHCWASDKDFTIHISGMITGSTQELPATDTTNGKTLANKITLTGFTGNTKDGINRGLANSDAVSGGSALIINFVGFVDITNLKFTGGNTSGNGGGICVNGPSSWNGSFAACPRVNLKSGVLVQGNKAVYGGGASCYHGVLCLSGTATIGNDEAQDRSAANTALSTGINIATDRGGGIYNDNANLYLGGVWGPGLSTGGGISSSSLTKGVYANICTTSSTNSTEKNRAAGGIYNYGSFYMMSGNVSYNYGVATGGVYSYTGGSTCFSMTGGTIHKNAGSGVYNASSSYFYMGGSACIGDGSTKSVAQSTDCSNNKGGLINAGHAWLGYSLKNTKSKLTGGIYRNYRSDSSQNSGGAGIVNTGTLHFNSGTIAYNYLYASQSSGTGGAGIFSTSTVYMEGDSSDSYACITNNVSNQAGGGIGLNGSDAKLFMYGYALIGKSSDAPPENTSTGGINKASRGGGIAAFNGASLYFGYSAYTSRDENTTASLDNGGVYFNYATTNGGGIYCQGSEGKEVNVYMASGKIMANKAYYSNGGTTYGHGGGIWANTYCDIYMAGGQISKNSAMNYGGGVYATGNLFMYGKALIGDTGTSVATSSSYGNIAQAGGGVFVKGASACLYMGNVGFDGSGNLSGGTYDDGYGILHNYASGDASDITSDNPTGFGGGVYFEGSTWYISAGIIGYNLSKKGGGATVKFTNGMSSGFWSEMGSDAHIIGNRAANGAGLYIYKYQINGSDIVYMDISGDISSNDAASDSGNGGGIYSHWAAISVSGSNAKINSNKAYNGGGIFSCVDGSELQGEIASAKLSDNAQISNNEALYYGGGVYLQGGGLEMKNASIQYNTLKNSSGKGGAVWLSDGTKFSIGGTIAMTPKQGNAGTSGHNDIFTPNTRAVTIPSPSTLSITGQIYITLTNNADTTGQYEVVGQYWEGTQPNLPTNTFYLTTGSAYYSTKKIGNKGLLVNK